MYEKKKYADFAPGCDNISESTETWSYFTGLPGEKQAASRVIFRQLFLLFYPRNEV